MELPFEFVVEGQPRSLQAKSSNKWKEDVRSAASQELIEGEVPAAGSVKVTVTYFFTTDTGIDADNILKPILDALKCLVYFDDEQITDVLSRKRDLNAKLRFINPPIVLNDALNADLQNFVHIVVEDAQNHEVIY